MSMHGFAHLNHTFTNMILHFVLGGMCFVASFLLFTVVKEFLESVDV